MLYKKQPFLGRPTIIILFRHIPMWMLFLHEEKSNKKLAYRIWDTSRQSWGRTNLNVRVERFLQMRTKLEIKVICKLPCNFSLYCSIRVCKILNDFPKKDTFKMLKNSTYLLKQISLLIAARRYVKLDLELKIFPKINVKYREEAAIAGCGRGWGRTCDILNMRPTLPRWPQENERPLLGVGEEGEY
jgi:hypothetical protein